MLAKDVFNVYCSRNNGVSTCSPFYHDSLHISDIFMYMQTVGDYISEITLMFWCHKWVLADTYVLSR